MNELALALTGDSAHTPPSHIVENLSDELAHARVAGAPHTIYEELWHAAFWQQQSLDRISGVETSFPQHNALTFPSKQQESAETWASLRERFLAGAEKAAALANRPQAGEPERMVRCLSAPGQPTRHMTVREQLESVAAHNAYHLGRVVLLRQLLGSWPPPSGGLAW
ncbi:MAG TPA: DinB family protein [Acidobacteriaceae bacterium]|nr:DinB family protein [Acidobacteriaceae bacterium]